MKHCRKSKGDCLSASGLGNCDDVVTAEGHGPSLTLYGSGRRETLSTDGGHDVLWEACLVKTGDRPGNSAALDLVKDREEAEVEEERKRGTFISFARLNSSISLSERAETRLSST